MAAFTREEWLAGVRAVADFIEANPGFDLPSCSFGSYLFGSDEAATKVALAAHARMLGTATKRTDDWYFRLEREFGPITLSVNATRENICHRVVVGTETVECQVPPEGVEMLTVTEVVNVYEWVCPESILNPTHESAVA